MELDWIQHVVTAIVLGFFFWYSNRKSTQKISKVADGYFYLRLNGFYKWVGYLGVGAGILFFLGANFSGEEDIFLVSLLMLILFGGLGIVLLMWYNNHEVLFDEQSIQVSSWMGKKEKMNWDEVDKVNFSPILGYLRLYAGSKKLNLHMHLIGLGELLNMMEEKTKFRASDLKLPFQKD